ncbi:MAG: tyrosine-type recombinase/integrase [Clostridia bacterium]|nr:tyrosine-type recombinase/integrase [Clostridia bacterium]
MLMTQKLAQKKKIYFGDMANSWLLYKKLTVKMSTYYNYKYIVDNYLNKKFKDYRLEEFLDFNINPTILELSEKLSPKTIKGIVSTLVSILNYAEEKYKVRFHLEPVAMPKPKIYELQVLTPREQVKLEQFCLNSYEQKYIGIVIALYTGMRIGELCALTWGNIDLKNKRIQVTKTLQRIYLQKSKTQILIDSPKSSKSIRKIPMNDKVFEILKNLKNKNEDTDFLLTGDKRYIEPRRYQYSFSKVLKELGLKDYNFHILRHTFATNCIKVGMDPKSLSEILGHSTVNITLNKYVHSSDKIKKKFLQKL